MASGRRHQLPSRRRRHLDALHHSLDLLTPLAILASWKAITHRVREYMIAFLVLETMMIGMFASLDMLMFYLFFEGVLIPMFIIIGVWGARGGSTRPSSSFSIRFSVRC